MTKREFANALRILLNIDFPEFGEAAMSDGTTPIDALKEWPKFRDNPHRWFITCSGKQESALWAIIEQRQPRPVALVDENAASLSTMGRVLDAINGSLKP